MCKYGLHTGMNGLSKAAASRIWPVARSSARCGARAGPRLIASDRCGVGMLSGKAPSVFCGRGLSRSAEVAPPVSIREGALDRLHRASLSAHTNESYANKRKDQQGKAKEERSLERHDVWCERERQRQTPGRRSTAPPWPGRRVYNYPKNRAIHSFSNSKVQSHKRSVHGFQPAGSGFWPVRPSWWSRRLSSPTRLTPPILLFAPPPPDRAPAPPCSMRTKGKVSVPPPPPPVAVG